MTRMTVIIFLTVQEEKRKRKLFSKSFYRVNQNKCISKQYSLKIEFAEIYSMIYD